MSRKLPNKEIQTKVLKEQMYRCEYCGESIGTVKSKFGYHWDHFVPYDYSQDNPDDNWVASCPRCNKIKNNLMFSSKHEASIYIIKKRIDKGELWLKDVFGDLLED